MADTTNHSETWGYSFDLPGKALGMAASIDEILDYVKDVIEPGDQLIITPLASPLCVDVLPLFPDG